MFCVKVKIKPTIVMVYSCLLENYYVMVGFMPMIVLKKLRISYNSQMYDIWNKIVNNSQLAGTKTYST